MTFKNSNISFLIIGFLIAIVLSLVCFYTLSNYKKQYAYVELSNLYSEFSLTKKLESEARSVELVRKNYIDSLSLSLNILEKKLRGEKSISRDQLGEFENIRAYILDKKREFDQLNDALKEKNDDQIWAQINAMLKVYGQDNGYEYIFGLNGTGNIMYSKEDLDITQNVIDYVNVKFSGK